MDRSQIEALLSEVSAGSTSVAAALERLRNLPFEDLGFAKLPPTVVAERSVNQLR